jgi:hypothetical protein
MYQKSIEGIALALTEAWNKFNDPSIPEKQKPAYLRLIKECNESIFSLTANGVSVLALKNIIERANRLGLGIEYTPLDEDQRMPLLNSGSSGSNNDTPLVWETKDKEMGAKDGLNHENAQ